MGTTVGIGNYIGSSTSLVIQSWTPQKIASKVAAWYNPLVVGGVVRDVNGRESIYWDMNVGSETLSAEQSSGVIIAYAVYKITATQANFFYTGCTVGDIFPCGTVKTCDANNKVQRVLGNHATQPVLADRPTNGVFDGVSNFMKTPAFTYAQPQNAYLAVNLLTWTDNDRIFDGATSNKGAFFQSTTTPKVRMYSGGVGDLYIIPINQLSIVRCGLNGMMSSILLNETTSLSKRVYSDAGTDPMGGITIGKTGAGSNYANINFKEAVFTKEVTGIEDVNLYNYLHSHNTIGNREINNFNKGKLLLTIDCCQHASAYASFQLFQAQGVKGTFYVTTDVVDTADKVTWAQLQEMYAAGMDIQCHGQTHVDFTALSDAQIIAQYDAVDAAFIAHGIPAPTHTAYPQGLYNDHVIEQTTPKRLTGRTISDSFNADERFTYKVNDKFRLFAVNVANNVQPRIDMTKFLNEVNLKNTAVIVYCHGNTVAGSNIEATTAYLNSIIDLAQTLNLDIVTISELYSQM